MIQNSNVVELVTATAKRSVGVLALVGTVGGFVNDVMSPLGNMATWMAWVSLLIAILSGIVLARHIRVGRSNVWTSQTAAILAIGLGSTLIFAVWSMVSANGPERGYLAENIEPIAQIQSRLLNLEAGVNAVLENTEEIAADVDGIKEITGDTAGQISAIATTQAMGFAAIQASFDTLHSQQALIENPVSAQEWYSNARIHQLRGETAEAIHAYEAYFDFNLTFVDPYLEYVSLLKATEGMVRTREILQEQLTTNTANPALTLAVSTLSDNPQERITHLLALAEQSPQFGPVYDELSKIYYLQFAQASSLMMVEKITEAHKNLFDLAQDEQFSRYFIDKKVAAESLDLAGQRLSPMVQTYQLLEPSVQIFSFYTGINPIFVVPGATRLWVGIDDPESLEETGSISTQGGSMPNTNNIGPILLAPGEHTLYYQYEDRLGNVSRLYSEPLTVSPIAIQFSQIPGALDAEWGTAAFFMGLTGATEGEQITYTYSIDAPTLERRVVITHEIKPISTVDLMLEDLTFGDHLFYVQGERADGSSTEVVEYPFSIEK